MTYIIYIVAKSKISPLLVGVTTNIRKAIELHNLVPSLDLKRKELRYVEISDTENEALERLKVFTKATKEQLIELITFEQNKDFIAIVPGANIDL